VFLVGLLVQEVQVPLAPFLGIAIHVRVVSLAPLKVNPIQDSSVPCHSGVLVSKKSPDHRGDWVLPHKCQNGVNTLRRQTPVLNWILV